VPCGAGNLVLRAARALDAAVGLPGGATFRLTKRIPAGAGLGGGSSDAAAALLALCSLYGLRVPHRRLEALALALGSDVPYFLRGGTALAMGRGEILTSLRLARGFQALIVVPAWRTDTAGAFRRIDRKKSTLTGWSAKSRFLKSLCRSAIRAEAPMRLGNAFEEVVGARSNAIASLRGRLLAGGALGARLTGSGSAVFGVFEERASLSALARQFDSRRYLVAVARPTKVGAALTSLE
jgi:4-diphosphocytidyl-2-C-methyl-D-erythritol kinase